MDRICLKCQHTKPSADGGLLEECPNCGAIYSRVEAQALRSKALPAQESKAKSSPWKPAPWAWPVLGLTIAILVYNYKTAPPKPSPAQLPSPPVCSGNDPVCLGDREYSRASSECRRRIENELRYDHEWTEGLLGSIFMTAATYEPNFSIIYHGQELRAQNGFGAWQRMRYFCVWDYREKRATKVGFND